MSLKDFHIVFILSSILLLFGFSYWGWQNFTHHPIAAYLWTAILSGISASALIAYEILFIKKVNA